MSNPALTMKLTGIQALDASAGTGKTYSIALIYLRLVLSGMSVERILVTTFTDAAAAELRERLRRRLEETRNQMGEPATGDANLAQVLREARERHDDATLKARLEDALSCFDLAPVCTIHGFCHRLLRDHALELGAKVESELMARDPRLTHLVDDFLASCQLDEPGEGAAPAIPTHAELQVIASKLREYGLPAPDAVPPEALLDGNAAHWLAETAQAQACAKAAWAMEREEIRQGVRQLVDGGQINPGVFDNPNALGEKRWSKLDNSVSETDTLLNATVSPEMKFGAGVKRFFFHDLLKAAHDSHRQAVEAFVQQYPVFAKLEALSVVFGEREDRMEDARRRGVVQRFLASVAKLDAGDGMLFSDLINAVYGKLTHGPFTSAVRERYEAVLVDECQDTDARQLEIFRILFADAAWVGARPDRCLVWVGDPKQSIYRFRGADIDTYVRAKHGATGGVLTLNVNFRSDKPLVAAINALFKGPGGQSVFGPGVDYGPSSANEGVRIRHRDGRPMPAFCLHTWRAGDQPASKSTLMGPVLRDCARRIRELLDSGMLIGGDGGRRVAANDIAVLAPEHRQLEIVRRELRRLGIPSAYQVDESVYLSSEARDLSLLLQALAAPRPPAVKAALCTPFFGYLLNEVAAIGESELSRQTERIVELGDRLRSEGFLSVLFALLRNPMAGEGAKQDPALVRLAGLPDGERILTNCIQLGELLQAAWSEGHARNAEALKDFLDQSIAGAAESSDTEASRLRLETDAPAVILSTIHKSKGLQYPVVFLPVMWAQKAVQQPPCIVRHGMAGACELILRGDLQWPAAFAQEKQRLEAEQMRLLYVSLTRGKHQVHAWWGRIKTDSGRTVSSTRNAFGSLLLDDPGGAESCTDDGCRKAFEDAMARDPDATFEVVDMDVAASLSISPDPVSGANEPCAEDGKGFAPARWTRAGLPGAPLQSSYSALLRRKPEAHRAEDEVDVLSVEDGDAAEDDASPYAVRDLLEPFQGGKVLGDRVHSAFEVAMSANDMEKGRVWFSEALAPDLSGLIRSGETVTDCAGVAEALWDVTVGARLPGGAVGSLFGEVHVPEWEYLLPQDSGLTSASLAGLMHRHGGGSPWGESTYVRRVRELGFAPLKGYFEGIVDLLGRLPDGQWVLADYKTNRLNRYGARDLSGAMAESHYLLQALLYTVAVKRWLEGSVAGWTYAGHFAGAAYLFLRGLKAGTRQGVWMEKPPVALVDALNQFFPERGAVDG